MREHYSQSNPPKPAGEYNSGEILVNTVGYRPLKLQIAEVLAAGQRLADYRKLAYDFTAGQPTDDNFIDPTRAPDFDMADAAAIIQQINQRYARRLAEKQHQEQPPQTPPEGEEPPT